MSYDDQIKMLEIEKNLEMLATSPQDDAIITNTINKVVADVSWLADKLQNSQAEITNYRDMIEILITERT